MPAQLIPIQRSQFLVTLKGIDCYWEKFSGIEDEAQTSEYSDGLSNRLFTLVGPRKLNDMTLEKAFDPIADKAVIDWFRTYCMGRDLEETISVTPVAYCPNPEPLGPSLILYGVRPISVKFAEADKQSNDVVTLELGIAADDYSYE